MAGRFSLTLCRAVRPSVILTFTCPVHSPTTLDLSYWLIRPTASIWMEELQCYGQAETTYRFSPTVHSMTAILRSAATLSLLALWLFHEPLPYIRRGG